MKFMILTFIFLLSSCNGSKFTSTLFLSSGDDKKTLDPAPSGGSLGDLPSGTALPLQARNYFVAYQDTNQILAVYIESAKKIYKVSDFPEGANITSIALFQNELYFSIEEQGDLSSLGGSEVWKLDMQSRNLSKAFDINTSGNGEPDFLTVYNGELYFRGNNGSSGRELMKYSSGNTATLVSDILNGAASSDPAQLTVVGGVLYFTAVSGGTVRLHSHNGTNTQEITGNYQLPKFLVEHQGVLYFSAADGRLYRVNGNAAQLVTTVSAGNLSDIKWPVSFNNKLYFAAMASNNIGSELYRLDGGNATLVSDINSGSSSSKPSHLTVLGDKLYFQARTSEGHELWSMDAGERLTSQEIVAGPDGSYPQNFFSLGDTLVFSAGSSSFGFELWKVDGDSAALWYDINSGSASSYPTQQNSLFD